jgi:hypothetical protein
MARRSNGPRRSATISTERSEGARDHRAATAWAVLELLCGASMLLLWMPLMAADCIRLLRGSRPTRARLSRVHAIWFTKVRGKRAVAQLRLLRVEPILQSGELLAPQTRGLTVHDLIVHD